MCTYCNIRCYYKLTRVKLASPTFEKINGICIWPVPMTSQ